MKLFKILFLILPTLIVQKSFCQAPICNWAYSAGGNSFDEGYDLVADTYGNIYTTGVFASDSISFGSFSLNNNGTSGTGDVLLVKHDISGNIIWAKSYGGTSYDAGKAIKADNNGNIYIAGVFHSDSIVIDNITLYSSGTSDIFVVKCDSSGSILWAISAGGSDYDDCLDLVLDNNQNFYITGFFASSNIVFGSYNLINSNNGIWDVYIAKFNSSGVNQWAKAGVSGGYDVGNSVSVDSMNNLYVTGSFANSTITFDALTLNNSTGNTSDIFLLKYDPAGNLMWGKRIGGSGNDYCNSICAYGNGIGITGYFMGSNFAIDTINLMNSASGAEIFISKFDLQGNVNWAFSSQGSGDDYSTSIINDIDGDFLLTGYYDSPTLMFNTYLLNNFGNQDIFIVKLDSFGNVIWTKESEGIDDELGLSMCSDINSNIYMTGSFYSDTLLLDTVFVSNIGNADLLLAKYSNNKGTNLEDQYFVDPVNIYPNPGTDEINIEILRKGVRDINFKLYTTLGVAIYNSTLKSRRSIINTDNLLPGIYYYQIMEINKVIQGGKLIIY